MAAMTTLRKADLPRLREKMDYYDRIMDRNWSESAQDRYNKIEELVQMIERRGWVRFYMT